MYTKIFLNNCANTKLGASNHYAAECAPTEVCFSTKFVFLLTVTYARQIHCSAADENIYEKYFSCSQVIQDVCFLIIVTLNFVIYTVLGNKLWIKKIMVFGTKPV